MANREELGVIRAARAGQARAQLELGKLYLFGSTGLPKSLPTALHWLDRAAQQDCAEAWELIGLHVPLGLAQQSGRPLAQWYERAFDAGQVPAGLVMAQLVLGDPHAGPAQRAKARLALEAAARAGLADAQWLLAQQQEAAPAADAPAPALHAGWTRRAADSGVVAARFALSEQAWSTRDGAAYLVQALPLARAVLASGLRPSADEAVLLSRCARALAASEGDVDQAELNKMWELAAAEHERHAQMAVGLGLARMRVDGQRIPGGPGSANFKKAIRWLTMAGEQGLAEAWYALSRIYIKPEFSQRNVSDAQAYLERAAEMGYRDAQLECGNHAWRARREQAFNDVRAVYWLQKAAAQGCPQARAALDKIAPAGSADDAGTWRSLQGSAQAAHYPLLAARLELGAIFRLTRAEALLLDVKAADQGHCLVVDIRASYGRSKRRLVMVETAAQRQALDRIVRSFEQVDAGPNGPEGNYRQRLYRLKTLAPEVLEEQYELAA
ncbi:MAG: hypothetical protein V4463_23875 [Pseudomonadota bacterium]